ncbi:ABC-type lipoprotein export system, ATPase component [Carnobacterium iners]|uniref:ABC-type lipoprotein export system, ATPase component n=1 Tax=Carnobacterium iners TaxID=1073423 RepID=A0A1X7NI72_9LACT|nr:ABC transporter ATP-binding protein/permease [Carnobacterium iners]SEK65324.1 ABC-type lipoprotein export system, ATPase component [Carnobacterium iners]SMH37523.1 ABC-type lipoprotein export system, ATPase component [Carnobacterium iners]
MAFLEVKKLNKYYPIGDDKQFHALKDVDLSFEKGELVSIIGESGSGKSTLMNLFGGLDSKFDGEILVEGKNIGSYTEKQMVQYHKEKIGFVFQSFNLVSHLSILDNVTLAMTLSNVDKETRMERAKTILDQLGLKEQYNKKPEQLSGGQKQRVAIARALVNDPDIIIADEPTGALDSETSEQVLDIIQQIAKGGKLVILVTHSERVAERSSRVVTIADGEIIDDKQTGPLKEVETSFSLRSLDEKQINKNLSIFSAIRMALLNMKEKLGRNVLIALGGSIGIMSIVLMLSLGRGVNDYLTETMNENVNPLVIEASMTDATESEKAKKEQEEKEAEKSKISEPVPGLPGENSAGSQNSEVEFAGPPGTGAKLPFEEENSKELEEIKNVKNVTEGFTSFSFTKNAIEFEDESYTYMNFGTVSPDITSSNIIFGELPKNNEVLITEGLATSIKTNPADMIGEEISVKIDTGEDTLESMYTISGIFSPGDSAGPAGIFDSVFMTMETFEALNKESDKNIEANVLYLTSESEEFTKEIKNQVKELGYAGSSADILTDIFSQMLDIFTYILTGVAGISLLVSAIMILTVLYISVVERTQEIGVIKAIGGRRKDIRRIFVSESFLIGLFSGILGVGLAVGLSFVGNIFVERIFDATVLHMTPAFAVAGILVSVLISVLAGLLPASKAAKLDPVEALRRG